MKAEGGWEAIPWVKRARERGEQIRKRLKEMDKEMGPAWALWLKQI